MHLAGVQLKYAHDLESAIKNFDESAQAFHCALRDLRVVIIHCLIDSYRQDFPGGVPSVDTIASSDNANNVAQAIMSKLKSLNPITCQDLIIPLNPPGVGSIATALLDWALNRDSHGKLLTSKLLSSIKAVFCTVRILGISTLILWVS